MITTAKDTVRNLDDALRILDDVQAMLLPPKIDMAIFERVTDVIRTLRHVRKMNS